MYCFDKSVIIKEAQYPSKDKIPNTLSFVHGRYTVIKKSLA